MLNSPFLNVYRNYHVVIAPQKILLKKEQIEMALNKWPDPDEALVELFSKWDIKQLELQQAINGIQLFSNMTVRLLIKVLIVLTQTKKEEYIPYVYQILFCEKMGAFLNKEIQRIETIYLNQNANWLKEQETDIFYSLLQILENSVQFSFQVDEMFEFIANLQFAITKISRIESIYQSHWVELKQRIEILVKLSSQYTTIFNIIRNSYKFCGQSLFGRQNQFEYEYTYKNCPIWPCELDFQEALNQEFTLCGKLSNIKFLNIQDCLKYHFLLLREDYLIEFKKQINMLRISGFSGIYQQKLQQIYLYYNVGVESIFVSTRSFKVLLSAYAFNQTNQTVDWGKTKRLLSGSLISLTSTNLKSFIYAQVLDRPKENKGDNRFYFTVKIISYDPQQQIDKLNKYLATKEQLIIIENAVFYDVYQSYLKCLQNKATDSFPFQDQIIFSSNETPKHHYQQDLSALDYSLERLFLKNQLLPKKLDPSQQKAIQIILNNQISLVQGPPGTGKTFCWALAVNLLMEQCCRRPILIVCQTNHALDQFLEHIMQFCRMDSVVRIGGRCKVDAFKPILLQTLREEQKKCQYNYRFDWPTFYSLKDALNWRLKNVLNIIDNIHYRDVVAYLPNLANRIVEEYQSASNLIFRNVLSEQSKQILVHMWLDSFKPRKEQFEKIITIEKQHRNHLLTQQKYEDKFEEIHYTGEVVNNFQLQNEYNCSQKFNEVNDDNALDSEEEEDRKIYAQINADESKISSMIDEKMSLKRLRNRLIFDIEDCQFALSKVNDYEKQIWSMSQHERNALQQLILTMKQKNSQEESYNISRFNSLIMELEELNMKTDLEIIQSKNIVGLTLSGCAKYAEKLEKIKYEVLVVEEAGEVLESHLISILSKRVKHLIMIGDHQQLKPNLNCYQLQEKFKANISLFEKLIHRGIEFVSLEYQRRMKSKFSDFIRLIYKNYKDHEDIKLKNDQQIPGMKADLIFFNHHWDENNDSHSKSKQNKFEARMIVLLTEYLLKNQIPPEKITILTTYGKQALMIQYQMQQKVKVQSVDNFQGEENDIIILSLVRSNKHKRLGFVAIDNRVCVALSRARLGLYIFGNFDFIQETITSSSNKSNLWLDILSLAKEKNVLLDYIPLQCDSHNEITNVKTIQDWTNVKNGGCTKICGQEFPCGHICQDLCHRFNHIRENCYKKCELQLDCGHYCEGMCKESPCPPCKVKIDKQMPTCLHIIKLECAQSPSNAKCTFICGKELLYGHSCKLQCWEDCQNNRCMDKMIYEHQICKHQFEITCDDQKYINKIICRVKCESLLQCGHKCQGICGLCFSKFHQPCKSICDQILSCGHNCNEKCGQQCQCKSECEIQCNCDIKCKKKCKEDCWMCENKCVLECSHTSCSRQCWECCDREPCNSQCNKQLDCGCQCIGLCGEVCPSICEIGEHNNRVCVETTNSKFYQLECEQQHIFQVDVLDEYFESLDLEHPITCPKCKSIISKSRRYQKYTKEAFNIYQKKKKQNSIIYVTEKDLNLIEQQIIELQAFIKEKLLKDKQSFLQNLRSDLKKELQSMSKGNKCKITLLELECLQLQLKCYCKMTSIMNSDVPLQTFKHHSFILIDQYLLNEDFRKSSQQQALWKIEQKLETLYLYQTIYDIKSSNSIQVCQQLLDVIEREEFFLTESERQEIQDNLTQKKSNRYLKKYDIVKLIYLQKSLLWNC